MAFDFPTSPANGAEYTSGGITYVFNGTGWTVKPSGGGTAPGPVDAYTKAESDANFVNVPGDTMTGNLIMGMPQPTLILSKPVGATANLVEGRANSLLRWQVAYGNQNPESAGNLGSDFGIYSYDDAGGYIGAPLSIARATGNVMMTGNLTVDNGMGIILNKTAAAAVANIEGRWGGLQNWVMSLSAANGGNFSLTRHNDTGALVDSPLFIDRVSGRATLNEPVVLPKGMVDVTGGIIRLLISGPDLYWDAGLSDNYKYIYSITNCPVGTAGSAVYQKLASGLIIQFGYVNPGGIIDVVFPIAFPTGVISVTMTHIDPAGNQTAALVPGVLNAYTTHFRSDPRYVLAGGTIGIATQGFYWMAMGH